MILMNYIEVEGIKIHWNFWLLPKGFEAITLFGHILFRNDKDYVDEILDRVSGKITINHERIHMVQAKSFKTKYFGFYIIYLWYWFIGLFKYINSNKSSYEMIPFEKEAYANQFNFNYNETHWKDYR